MKFKKYETNYKFGKLLSKKEVNGFEEDVENKETENNNQE